MFGAHSALEHFHKPSFQQQDHTMRAEAGVPSSVDGSALSDHGRNHPTLNRRTGHQLIVSTQRSAK